MMRLSTRSVQGLFVLSIAAPIFLSFQVATSVERRQLDGQRASRPPASNRSAGSIDGDALMATVRTLASPEFEGRQTGSAGGVNARTWIVERFKAIPLEPLGSGYVMPFTLSHLSIKGPVDRDRSFRTDSTDAANVVGLCAGRGKRRETIVVSAHYDHLGMRGGVVYPGADDNASGVAGLLAIAERCRKQPFRHDVIFVAFDAEELGLQGSKAFVASPPVPKDRLALDINLDMVGRSDRRELFAAGTYHYPMLRRALEQVASRSPVALRFGHDKPAAIAGAIEDWTNQSDHGSFHAAGVPFIYFGVEDHADYHEPTDTPDKIDATFFRQSIETILDAVTTLDARLPRGR